MLDIQSINKKEETKPVVRFEERIAKERWAETNELYNEHAEEYGRKVWESLKK